MSERLVQTANFVTPVGSVIAYAGQISPASTLDACGWLSCDGNLYSTTSYADLYAVIQDTNGASGTSQFAVPDYRGVFLRGADLGAGNDPDAASRTAPRPTLPLAGVTGDYPGSYQADAPRSHTHGYEFTNNPYSVMAETHNQLANDSVWVQQTTTSGGSETRPVNTYVNFLICWTASTAGVANPAGGTAKFSLPVGVIVPFAGDPSAQAAELLSAGFQVCDGSGLDTTTYAGLFDLIQYTYGGSDAVFNVPDLRGCFLRGVDGNSGRDPDAATRAAPSKTGSGGDAPGSFQTSQIGSHSHSYDELDMSNYHRSDDGLAGDCQKATSCAGTTSSTGGSETRPVNMNVAWMIKIA